MGLNVKDKTILAAIELTYGTDPVPTAALNAVLSKEFSLTPLEATELTRDLDLPGLGLSASELVKKARRVSLKIEAAGSGTAGDATAYGPLLRAGGLAETLTALTDAQYDPVSSGFESVTLYYYLKDHLFKMLGARAELGMEWDQNSYPYFTIDLLGLIQPVATAAPSTPDFSAFQKPLEINKANTQFSLHGFAAVLQNLNFTFGNQVVFKDRPNQEIINITDRGITGTLVIEEPPLATKDFYTAITSRTAAPLQVIHGTAAGNIVQLDMPKVELGAPTHQDDEGTNMLSIPFRAIVGTGDDEIKITLK